MRRILAMLCVGAALQSGLGCHLFGTHTHGKCDCELDTHVSHPTWPPVPCSNGGPGCGGCAHGVAGPMTGGTPMMAPAMTGTPMTAQPMMGGPGTAGPITAYGGHGMVMGNGMMNAHGMPVNGMPSHGMVVNGPVNGMMSGPMQAPMTGTVSGPVVGGPSPMMTSPVPSNERIGMPISR